MVGNGGKKTGASGISPKQQLKLPKKMGLNNFYFIIVLTIVASFRGFEKSLLITII